MIQIIDEIPKKENFRVYFLMLDQDDVWKVGFTGQMKNRRNALSSSHHRKYSLQYEIACDDKEAARALERDIKRYVRKAKTRDKNSNKCEFFYASLSQIKNLIKRLNSENRSFLITEKFIYEKHQEKEVTSSEDLTSSD